MKESAVDIQAHDDAERMADADHVRRSLAGETAAYDRLIQKYQRRAVAVSYRLLGDIQDAMDVTQDAFLKAFKSLDTLHEPPRFGAWLMRIVSNLSLNYRRGRRQNLSLAAAEDGESLADRIADRTAAGRSSGSDALASAELESAITTAIGALPEPQRLALVLFSIEGLPQKEVADVLECSVEMVKWHVFQARKTLRKKLADYL